MIGVSDSASRIAPTRPSIMSLGATTSAPASTWLTAVRASSSSVASLSTSSPSRTLQWPCDVYSHMQTSVTRTRSGKRARSARRARWTMPSSSYAPDPSSSFSSGIPKTITAATPSAPSSSTSPTTLSTEWRPRPGSSGLGRASGPMKSGITKSSRWSRVSRTRPRNPLVRRRRRSRVTGNVLTPEAYAHERPSQRVAVPDPHAGVPAAEAETFVERDDVLVAAEVDHVQVAQLGEQAPHQLGADAATLVLREHLDERDVRAEDAVADRGEESEDAISVRGDHDVTAPSEDVEMACRRRRLRPVDEEPLQMLGVDAVEVGPVLDHASNLRVAKRARAPKIAPRPASHANSRATAPQGSTS